jgi:hypothetical protein
LLIVVMYLNLSILIKCTSKRSDKREIK